jgi:hypothetical protein
MYNHWSIGSINELTKLSSHGSNMQDASFKGLLVFLVSWDPARVHKDRGRKEVDDGTSASEVQSPTKEKIRKEIN